MIAIIVKSNTFDVIVLYLRIVYGAFNCTWQKVSPFNPATDTAKFALYFVLLIVATFTHPLAKPLLSLADIKKRFPTLNTIQLERPLVSENKFETVLFAKLTFN